VQAKLEKLSAYPDYVRFLFEPVSPDGADPETCRAAADALAGLETWETPAIEQTLRTLADRLGLKPRQAFAPIRLAITGSTVSPSLFESLELLGREESLARLRAAG
jgi:glutamyl-tRNA synthetase